MFLAASVLPLLLGTALGFSKSLHFDSLSFILALLSVSFIHLSINALNDVYDELNGTDRLNTDRISPFTGGSRVIQDNIMSLAQMRRCGIVFLASASIPALMLLLVKGPTILLFGLAGVITGIAYSVPPLKLAARGLGELAVATGFGVIIVTGAAWLQMGMFSSGVLLIAIPAGLWVANVLLINEVPDANADSLAGKRTLVVRFGNLATSLIYTLNNVIAALLIFIAGRNQLLPQWAIILPLTSALAGLFASYSIRQWPTSRELLRHGIKLTLVIQAANSLWLTASILI